MTVRLAIDGREVTCEPGVRLLTAALDAGVYIPHLCAHRDLAPAPGSRPDEQVFRGGVAFHNDQPGVLHQGCGLCVVEVQGLEGLRLACEVEAADGMVVASDAQPLRELRRERLGKILATHPHACLTCAQREGCSREPCSTNVAFPERCCPLLGRCELEKLADFVGIPPATPRYLPRGLPADRSDPLIGWEPELCIGCLRCVRACRDLKGAGAMGYVLAGGETVVGLVAPTRLEAGCRYCGACVEVCPTGTLTDRGVLSAREEELVPCRTSCPAGMDVPRFLRAAAAGRLDEAALVALDRLPLPHSLSRVCFHPCEERCRRTELGGSLSVCRVRRQVFEAAGTPSVSWPQPNGGRPVAVVGAGPAGLAAAHFLRRLGHRVTVFEAESEAGGMLRHGIPAYRLPQAVLDRDIELLESQGVELRTGVTLGRDVTLSSLRADGFAAVLLACGAGAGRPLPAPGTDLPGVVSGVELLREVRSGAAAADTFAGQRVLVVGGGNVAVDAARTARRLGAATVTLACLESEEEMPAHRDEVAAAREEGVDVVTSRGVGAILGNGRVSGARLVLCVEVFDPTGRFAPRFDPDVAHEVPADAVVLAIGQRVDPALAQALAGELPLRSDGFVAVDPSGAVAPGVFACGDLSLGPSSVVRSIGSARSAAQAVDRFLGGSGEIPSLLLPEQPSQRIGPAERFAERARVTPDALTPTARAAAFAEVELTLDRDRSLSEAGRCLQCDLRLRISAPVFPPEPWLELSAADVATVPAVAGVYQLLGEDHVPLRIAGTPDLRAALESELAAPGAARCFTFEPEAMYTKRESELIQQHLARFGQMPSGADDLDDLF